MEQEIDSGDEIRVFLSYASEDRQIADQIHQAISKEHIVFFQDIIDMRGGEKWFEKIEEQISLSDYFLLIDSEASRSSVWVQREIGIAQSRIIRDEIEFIPFKVDTKLPSDSFLDRFHSVLSIGELLYVFDDEISIAQGTLLNDEQSKELNRIKEEIGSNLRFKFLLTGRTGTGKSSTINTLLGQYICDVNHHEPETMEVTHYDGQIEGVNYTVIDTPGLADEDKSKYTDEKYLTKIANSVTGVNCMLFVTKLSDSRIEQGDRKAIRRITKFLDRSINSGGSLWNHSVVVLTHADKVSPPLFDEKLRRRSEFLRSIIHDNTQGRVDVQKIPFIPAANEEVIGSGQKVIRPGSLDNGQEWLGDLYLSVLGRVEQQGAEAFFFATVTRVKTKKNRRKKKKNDITLNDRQIQKLKKEMTKWDRFKEMGREIKEIVVDVWDSFKKRI